MSISKASREFEVPRMSLSDRVNGKLALESRVGASTALSEDEEIALL